MGQDKIIQLERRVADLERLVKQLLAPKSKARLVAEPRLDIYLFTLTSTLTSGVAATADIRTIDDSELFTDDVPINDPLGHFEGLTSGYRGWCLAWEGEYYALGPYVTQVRWDDPDLEYSRDGSTTWINIDTAEDC